MGNIKSLADQLRSKIAEPGVHSSKPEKNQTKKEVPLVDAQIVKAIMAYDNADHKSMVHVRFDKKTSQTLNHFKMATGIDVTKLVAFAVKRLLEQQPEIKSIVKQYIQNLEL